MRIGVTVKYDKASKRYYFESTLKVVVSRLPVMRHLFCAEFIRRTSGRNWGSLYFSMYKNNFIPGICKIVINPLGSFMPLHCLYYVGGGAKVQFSY